MGVATRIETVSDTATPWLQELQGRIAPHRIAAEVGPRCTRLVQRNFRSLGQNAKGWPSTHFYGRAAEATNWQEGFGFVMISVNQIGIRQRLMGGTIKPVNAQNLTIPARPEAYGKTAREFSNLQFKFVLDPESGRMRPALVEKTVAVDHARTRNDGGRDKRFKKPAPSTVEALFWLAKSVKQEADPDVMPSDEDFEEAFDQSVKALLRE